jgi:hypothetical protein
MPTITTADGTEIFYKDWGPDAPGPAPGLPRYQQGKQS